MTNQLPQGRGELPNLSGKDYYKPNATKGFASGHVHNIGDFVPLRGYKAVVLPRNKEKYIPEPSKNWMGLSDVRPLSPGDRVLIDTVTGFSELHTVKVIRGNVLELVTPMNNLPALGGDVYKIVGTSTDFVDTRFDLSKESHVDAFARQEEETRQRRLEELRKQGLA